MDLDEKKVGLGLSLDFFASLGIGLVETLSMPIAVRRFILCSEPGFCHATY